MNNRYSTNPISRGNSHNKSDVPGKGSPTAQSCDYPILTSQDDFPSLSDSMSSNGKGKTKNRIDLGYVSQQNLSKEVHNIGPSQTQASVSLKNQTKLDNVDSLRPQLSAPKNNESLSPYKHGQIQNDAHGETKRSSLFYSSRANLKNPLSPQKSLQPHYERREAERSQTCSPPRTNKKKHIPLSMRWQPPHEHGEANTSSWKKPISPHKRLHPHHERREAERSPTIYPPGTNKKKYLPPSECWQFPNEHGEANTSSNLGTSVNECFDICSPDTQRYNASRRSAHAKNMGKWVPKDEKYLHNMELEIDSEHLGEEDWEVLRPGMVLLKSYIPLRKQVEIVKSCQELGLGPGGFYRPGYKDGAKLRLYMMCLGQDWNAQTRKYGKIREHDNAVPPDIPPDFASLVDKALDDCHAVINRDLNTINAEDVLPRMSPDVCIVNFYNTNGRLGLHQDRDESRRSLVKGLPVVSLSIGDSAEFLYGDDRDVDKAESVLLESGDVLIFGGESRHIFHGVTTIYPNTAPRPLLEKTKLRPGRLNLTFRKY